MEKVDSKTTIHQPNYHYTSWNFRFYLIVSTIALWSLHALILRYTRTVPPEVHPPYLSTTVVVLADFSKLIVASFLLLRANQFDLTRFRYELRDELWKKPWELLKMSVPSLVYTIQNNLDFVALSNLSAALFTVLSQLKVVTTALFMTLMLGRRFSFARWIAIFFVFIGISLVLIDASPSSHNDTPLKDALVNASLPVASTTGKGNFFVGVSAVLFNCFLAGFAGRGTFAIAAGTIIPALLISGVYFEKMLKDSHTSLWIRNIQLYLGGVVCSGLSCAAYDGRIIQEHGFFYGYHFLVWMIIGLLCFGGIFISMVMKYLDNIHKSFAAASSVLVVSLVSYVFFDSSIGIMFCIGSFLVCSSIVVYNYVPS
ncbi:unnamed protein product [Soboliphyme baturini]|uniref:UDP-galactose transporter n=1 Tax=Soboliphyme baturini TaxID=241478 RepID=A0A183INW0_9BILA|nr:unnamed protein product [Soboliphyme baturini]